MPKFGQKQEINIMLFRVELFFERYFLILYSFPCVQPATSPRGLASACGIGGPSSCPLGLTGAAVFRAGRLRIHGARKGRSHLSRVPLLPIDGRSVLREAIITTYAWSMLAAYPPNLPARCGAGSSVRTVPGPRCCSTRDCPY